LATLHQRLPTEIVIGPAAAVEAQVPIPGNAGPIKLEALDLEFCGRILEVKAGSGIVTIIQEPLHRVDIHSDVDGMGFQTLAFEEATSPYRSDPRARCRIHSFARLRSRVSLIG
jgi:hypothetical protein